MSTPIVPSEQHGDQQVFQPVPTQDDLRAMSYEVQQGKRKQARLLVTVIFLAGVVAASAAAMFFIYANTNSQLATADKEVTAQAAQIKKLEAEIAAAGEKAAAQQTTIDSFASFQSIALLQQQSDALEREIADLLAQPSRANAPARLKKLPDEVEWYDGVVSALSDRRAALQKLKAEAEAWPPAAADPRPD